MLCLLEFLNNSCDQIKMLFKFSPVIFLVQLPLCQQFVFDNQYGAVSVLGVRRQKIRVAGEVL